jgi:cytochrome c oxidase subunit 2
MKKALSAIAAFFTGMYCFAASAAVDNPAGYAEPGQMGFQGSVTEIMDKTISFHDMLMVIITVVTIFVLFLLGYVAIKFNAKANPVPSKTSHHTVLEIVWTVVPIAILVVIGVPSFKLLYFQDTIPESDLVIKVTGHQWYWSYEYVDEDGLSFDSIMLPSSYFTEYDTDAEIKAEMDEAKADIQRMMGRTGDLTTYRLLETDTRIVVPINSNVKLEINADDVIHSWAMPSFGIKIDAVPGRTNQAWFNANTVGTYYGQCSELCGIKHAFMPIVVEVVSAEDYKAWVARAKAYFASTDFGPSATLADASPIKQ